MRVYFFKNNFALYLVLCYFFFFLMRQDSLVIESYLCCEKFFLRHDERPTGRVEKGTSWDSSYRMTRVFNRKYRRFLQCASGRKVVGEVLSENALITMIF